MSRLRVARLACIILIGAVPAFASIQRTMPAATPRATSFPAPVNAMANPLFPQVRSAPTPSPQDLPSLPAALDPLPSEAQPLHDLGLRSLDRASPWQDGAPHANVALDTSDPWSGSLRLNPMHVDHSDPWSRPGPLRPLSVDSIDPWNGQTVDHAAAPRLQIERADPWHADEELSF